MSPTGVCTRLAAAIVFQSLNSLAGHRSCRLQILNDPRTSHTAPCTLFPCFLCRDFKAVNDNALETSFDLYQIIAHEVEEVKCFGTQKKGD